MNKPKTYRTKHPIIKEIRIGDQFVLNSGHIVTFVEYYDKVEAIYPILMLDIYNVTYTFSKDLIFELSIINHKFDIKHRYIPLKDKLEML